jgi:hypothetical protein
MTDKQDKEKMIEFMAESIRETFTILNFAVVSNDVCKMLAEKLNSYGWERLTRDQCFEHDACRLRAKYGVSRISDLDEKSLEIFVSELTAMGYGPLDFARSFRRQLNE